MQEKAHASDELKIEHTQDQDAPVRKTYRVTSEHGLFKNGKQYDEGQTIELDEKTAANFIANGDVEDVEAGDEK